MTSPTSKRRHGHDERLDDMDVDTDIDRGYAWIIVAVVMLNFFQARLPFAAFSVLYSEYVYTFEMGVGKTGLALSACSAMLHSAGISRLLYSLANCQVS